MQRLFVIALIALGLVAFGSVDALAQCGGGAPAAAGCGLTRSTCGTTTQACPMAAAKKGGCPIEVALTTLKLTDAQEKKVAAAKAELKASLAKAGNAGCPIKASGLRKTAGKTYKGKVLAALTPKQQKALAAALAKPKAAAKQACCTACLGAKK